MNLNLALSRVRVFYRNGDLPPGEFLEWLTNDLEQIRQARTFYGTTPDWRYKYDLRISEVEQEIVAARRGVPQIRALNLAHEEGLVKAVLGGDKYVCLASLGSVLNRVNREGVQVSKAFVDAWLVKKDGTLFSSATIESEVKKFSVLKPG